jgi:hypothetical protein
MFHNTFKITFGIIAAAKVTNKLLTSKLFSNFFATARVFLCAAGLWAPEAARFMGSPIGSKLGSCLGKRAELERKIRLRIKLHHA